MPIPFLNDVILKKGSKIQFTTDAGANAGTIDTDSSGNLVFNNTAGDILLGDGASDVYIGDGANNVDIIFEQSGSIKGDGSAVTLTLGGANTTLNLENPNFNGNINMSSKLKFTTTNGFILFDYEPTGDTGEYATEVPLIKVDRSGEESTILARISEYRGIALGIDDTTWIRAGDTSSVVRSNVNLADEVVLMSAESGFRAIGFPGNDTAWSNRNEFMFYSASTTASNNGLYLGDGGSTQFIDLSRNLKNIGTITSGAISATGDSIMYGKTTVYKSSSHTAQGSFSANNAHLDLYNPLQANTDQKGSIITFTDNYYDGSSYVKTTRAGIKGGTDTTGNTADGYLEFYTDSGGANTPNLALRLDKDQNATFAGNVRLPNSGQLFLWNDHDSNFLQYNLWQGSASGGMTIKNIASGGDIIFQTVSTTALTLDSSQNATFSGHVKIASSKYLEFSAMGKLINLESSAWGTGAQEHNLLYSGWTSATGDYLSIKVAGNSTSNHGNLILGDNGLWYGIMDTEDTAQATDSATNPNGGSNRFRVDNSGNGVFAGTVTANGTVLTGATSLAGYATESYVDTAVSNLVGTAPGTLDTLQELGDALGDDPNFATTITTSIGTKVSKSGGDTITSGGNIGLTINHDDFNEGLVIHRNHNDNSPSITFKNNQEQIGILFAQESDDNVYWRQGTNTTNRKIWHSGNDGASSGLDADTLDGNHASAFLTSHQDISGKLNLSGGTMSGTLNMGNNNISGVNALQFADPGPSEGVTWTNTKIYESPNDLTTNTSGNLQLVYNNTRRLTVDNSGIDVNGNIVVSGTVDGVDIATRDGVLTSTTTTANAAAPKASPTFTGDITIPNKIIHTGDTDTYMQFEAGNVWRVVTGGTERLDINTNRILVGDGMMMQYDNISGGNVDGNNVQQSGNSGTVVRGGFLNPAAEANMVHIPHIINDLAGFNKWSNATITTSGFYKSRSGSSGSYTYSNEVTNTDGGWPNAFDAHSSTAGSWYSDNGSDGIYQHGTDTPGVVELEWTNEATYSLWAGIVFGSGSFTPTYVKIEAYRAGAWQTLCEITDNTDQVILRQVANNSGTNAATRRLRYTLGGSVNNSYFRIHSLYMVNYAAGSLNLNNTGTDTTRGVNFLERYKDGYLHGHLRPGADNTYDLGSSSYEWKNGYFDGTVYLDGINLDGNTITGVNDSGEFDDDDAHIMTSAGVDDRISTRISGLTSNAGTVTGTGADTRLAVWSSGSALTSDSTLLWRDDNSTPANKELYVGGRIIPTLGVKLDDGSSHSPSVSMTSYGGGSNVTWQMYARSSTQLAIQTGSDIVFELTTNGNLTLDGTIDATNLSGTNTGDQDISGIATNATAISNITSFPGFGTTSGTALEGDTTLFSGAYADLTGKPTLFDGAYSSLSGLPTLFDGAYSSLTGKPTIPSGNQIIDWTAENAGTIHSSNYTNTVDMGSGFIVANNGGTNQFTIVEDNALRFAGTGATTVSFNSTTKKVTIDSPAETYTAHENITAASSSDNSGRTYIQDITLDSNGHVTGIATASETVTNTNTQLSNSQVISAISASTSIASVEKAVIRSNIGAGTSSFDGAYSSLSGTPTIPTATSDLTNDSGFLTSSSTQSKYIRSDADDTVSGHTEWQDSKEIRLGNDADFRIYHDGTNNFIRNYKHGANNSLQSESSMGSLHTCVGWGGSNGYANLFYNGSQKLITSSAGISVTGSITASSTIGNLNSSSDIGQQMEYGTTAVATLRCDANRWRVYMGGSGNSQETLTVNESGNVGIKDSTPSYRLDVNGTFRATGDVIAFSDERVKENIKTIDNSLEKVNKLRGVEFNKIGEDNKSIGVIAQEIEKILPEVVRTDDEGMKSVAYGNIVGVLIEAVKELTKEVQELKKCNKCKNCNCND